jgi:hypothetical protein
MRQVEQEQGKEKQILLKALPQEFWPISKRASHHAAVDKIEFVGERP